jgi:hypothetical protein
MTHPNLEVLDPNRELKSIPFINPRDTNPWKILDKMSNDCYKHGMMETIFLPIDIYEETPFELEKKDYIIDEHGSYFMNTSSNPCSYEKSPESIDLSTTTHEIFNPLILPTHKNFERVVIDAYVYHKYCRSHCVNLEIGTLRVVLEGKPLHQLEAQLKGFPRMSFCPKASTFER